MQSTIVLRRKAGTARNLLYLLLAIPIKSELRADRTPIAGRPLERKFQPLILFLHRILVNQQGTALIGYHHIKYPAIPQISQRHRAAVIDVGRPDSLGYVDKLCRPIVDPDLLLLISR